MMIVPDTNLLVFAYDSTSPCHAAAKKWWEDVLSGDKPVGIPWVVVLAFTRLMTHPTICTDPLTTEEVRRIIGHWIGRRNIFSVNSVRLIEGCWFSLVVFS